MDYDSCLTEYERSIGCKAIDYMPSNVYVHDCTNYKKLISTYKVWLGCDTGEHDTSAVPETRVYQCEFCNRIFYT